MIFGIMTVVLPQQIAVSNDNNGYACIVQPQNNVKCWNLVTTSAFNLANSTNFIVNKLEFNLYSTMMCGGNQNTIKCWNVASNKLINTYNGDFLDFCYGQTNLLFVNSTNDLISGNGKLENNVLEIQCYGNLMCVVDDMHKIDCYNTSNTPINKVFSTVNYNVANNINNKYINKFVSVFNNGQLICGIDIVGTVRCWTISNGYSPMAITITTDTFTDAIKFNRGLAPCYVKKDSTYQCVNNYNPTCNIPPLTSCSTPIYEIFETTVNGHCQLDKNYGFTCRQGISAVLSISTTLFDINSYYSGVKQQLCVNGTIHNLYYQGSSVCGGVCSEGTYGTGLSECTQICPKGYYCPKGSSIPTPCPAGTYNNIISKTSISDCNNCPLGYYCPLASDDGFLNLCLGGYYGNLPNQISKYCNGQCDPGYRCLSGSISSRQFTCGSSSVYCPIGSSNPLPVSNGYFSIGGQTLDTGTGQQICPIGYYCNLGIKTLCTIGTYSNSTGNTECFKCEDGTVAPTIGATSCIICNNGTVSGTTFPYDFCQGCQPGKYQPKSKQAVCIDCSSGKYQPISGQSSCYDCEDNTYSNFVGSKQCSICSGYVSLDKDNCLLQSQCYGGYAPGLNSSLCDKCPINTYSLANSSQCYSCPDNTYTLKEGSTQCIICDQIGLSCFSRKAVVDSGYWAYVNENEGTISTYRCQYISDCKEQVFEYMNTPHACPIDRDQSIDNILCKKCAQDYILWNDKCILCNKSNGGLVFLLLFLGFVYIIFLHITSQKSSIETSFLIYSMQAVAIYFNNISPPGDTNAIFKFFNIQLERATGEWCVVPITPDQYYVFYLISPFILFGLLLTVAAIHYLIIGPFNFCIKRYVEEKQKYLLNYFTIIPYFRTGCSLLHVTYIQWAKTIFEFLDCVNIANQRVVRNTPALLCTSSEYSKLYGVIIFFLVFFVIILPIGFFILFYVYPSILETNTDTGKIFDVWTCAYKKEKRFWAIVSWLKRAFLVACSMINDPLYRLTVFGFYHWAFKYLNNKFKPYNTSKLKSWDNSVLTYLLILSMLCTVLYDRSIGYINNSAFYVLVTTALIVMAVQIILIIKKFIDKETDTSINKDKSLSTQSIELAVK